MAASQSQDREMLRLRATAQTNRARQARYRERQNVTPGSVTGNGQSHVFRNGGERYAFTEIIEENPKMSRSEALHVTPDVTPDVTPKKGFPSSPSSSSPHTPLIITSPSTSPFTMTTRAREDLVEAVAKKAVQIPAPLPPWNGARRGVNNVQREPAVLSGRTMFNRAAVA